MKDQLPPARGRLAARLGALLLLAGAVLVAVPAIRWAREELADRRQMAQVPTPSPVMLQSPGDLGRTGGSDGPGLDAGTGGPGSGEGSSVPDGGGSGEGGAAALYQISIPRLKVSYPVGEGVDNDVLDRGPGHYPQTVLPGEVGNAALAGHRTIRGRPAFFYRLNELEPGDLVHVHYTDRSLTFVVERVFLTDPYDLSVIAATDYPALTLTTCDPPGSDEMRLIVQARLQSNGPTPQTGRGLPAGRALGAGPTG
ncbi:sortase A [Symbiobacterium terraclitae]|uniref:Sortase A n=1 Tax=Symbiobacterium terraclitae TaxID=557451 RepID=A0ABS4JTI3_9FIRM|nr:class E sortase [Symbiobacterium terraclitae]MBP2018845.1 sortase A [Symbiobacterium terraclitae]